MTFWALADAAQDVLRKFCDTIGDWRAWEWTGTAVARRNGSERIVVALAFVRSAGKTASNSRDATRRDRSPSPLCSSRTQGRFGAICT